jgi:hypothetical protein
MNKPIFSAPYPTKAQMDYRQNGLVLPKEIKNLEILLRDVQEKGFLDIELLYRLRQRESLKRVEQEIEDTIRDIDEDNLRESSGLFQRAFKTILYQSLKPAAFRTK